MLKCYHLLQDEYRMYKDETHNVSRVIELGTFTTKREALLKLHETKRKISNWISKEDVTISNYFYVVKVDLKMVGKSNAIEVYRW